MRALWCLFALIPGAPAIGFGRVVGGALLLLLGFGGWELWVFGSYLIEGSWAEPARIAGIVLASSATLASVVWTGRLTSRRRRARLERETSRALATAHQAYLGGDVATAQDAVAAGLQVDARDIDLLFLDWHFARERGDARRARRSRRRLRRLDLDEKWLWDVEREEAVSGRS